MKTDYFNGQLQTNLIVYRKDRTKSALASLSKKVAVKASGKKGNKAGVEGAWPVSGSFKTTTFSFGLGE